MKTSSWKPTRRSLVQAAAIVPFAAVAGSAANSAVKVGLLGAGGRGSSLTGYMRSNTRGQLVALADIQDSQIEKAKKRIPYSDLKVYKDYNEMLASDIDAVIIATPVFKHAEHFEAAVKAGKHIYIEKPAAGTIADCKRIMRAADSAGSKINITFGFQRRYAPVYQRAKKLIDSGAVGKINAAHAHFIKNLGAQLAMGTAAKPATELERVQNWKYWRETFGGALVETFVHSVDALNMFMGGHPSSAYGSGGRRVMTIGDLLDHIDVAFTYPSGLRASLTGSFIASPKYRDVNEVYFCENGTIETAQEYWIHYRNGFNDYKKEDSPRNIGIDSVVAFIDRVADGKLENAGVRGAESTLTAIMGQMAIDKKREVTWDEVIRS